MKLIGKFIEKMNNKFLCDEVVSSNKMYYNTSEVFHKV